MSRMKGKWAQGIKPRNFAWIIRDRLAICERPGGYGANHRRVRRQEEIIWLREQGFTRVISLIPSPHNLHNYDELGLPYLHRPFGPHDESAKVLGELYPEMRDLLASRSARHPPPGGGRATDWPGWSLATYGGRAWFPKGPKRSRSSSRSPSDSSVRSADRSLPSPRSSTDAQNSGARHRGRPDRSQGDQGARDHRGVP